MKAVFPCIITKIKDDLYSAEFPDLSEKKTFGTNLYDVLKTAGNILLIELYVKEMQRLVIPDNTDIGALSLNSDQFATYIICDTEILGNMLDIYDNVQTDDLELFLKEKDKEAETYAKLQENETKPIEKTENQPEKPDELEELEEDEVQVVVKETDKKPLEETEKTESKPPQRPRQRYNNRRHPKKT